MKNVIGGTLTLFFIERKRYQVHNSVAVITGVSHSRSIGAAICRQLAKQGVDIFFTHWQAVRS